MLNRITILILFLLGAVTSISFAQGSAQATMRVSVQIVKGVSVDALADENVILKQNEISEIGKLTLQGLERDQALISISNKISLSDSQGNSFDLDVKSRVGSNDNESTNITLAGGSTVQMKAGSYQGEISTTIEYL